MLSKIQVGLCILAGVGVVIFIAGVTTNMQVKQFGPVSGLLPLLAWGSFGLVFASCVGVVVTQVLEFREPKEPKAPKPEAEESSAEKEAPAEELAPIVATVDEAAGDVEIATAGDEFEATTEFETPTDFDAAPLDLQSELDAGEGLGDVLPDFDDLSDLSDFKDE